jgi:hypothetical protein
MKLNIATPSSFKGVTIDGRKDGRRDKMPLVWLKVP